jgi:hypothetical protein
MSEVTAPNIVEADRGSGQLCDPERGTESTSPRTTSYTPPLASLSEG